MQEAVCSSTAILFIFEKKIAEFSKNIQGKRK